MKSFVFKSVSTLFAIICISILSYGQALSIPTTGDRVVDMADILEPSQETVIGQKLQKLEQSTTTEMAVIILTGLGGEAIEDVSIQIAESRGIGKADTNNGLLLLIAMTDRERRIEVGYGLEGVIPDAIAYRIGSKQLVPALQEGNYFDGISTVIDTVSGLVSGEFTATQLEQDRDRHTIRDYLGWLLAIGFFSMFTSAIVRVFVQKKKTRRIIAPIGSLLTSGAMLWWISWLGLLYWIPAFAIWWWIMNAKEISTGSSSGSSFGSKSSSSTSTWSSKSSSSSSSGTSFGGGSFGGGGAGGKR